jgi:hypothetical protein
VSEPNTDLERVAVHEAGHAAAGYVLKRSCKVVSIVPSRAYSGVTIFPSATTPDLDRANLLLPPFLHPARFRRFNRDGDRDRAGGIMRSAVTVGAEDRYVAEGPDEERALQIAASAILTQGESEHLERAVSAPGPFRTDEESAERLSWALAGDESAGAYLNWLRVETRPLVLGSRFRGYVNALVPALLEHKTISGRAARRLMQDTITD